MNRRIVGIDTVLKRRRWEWKRGDRGRNGRAAVKRRRSSIQSKQNQLRKSNLIQKFGDSYRASGCVVLCSSPQKTGRGARQLWKNNSEFRIGWKRVGHNYKRLLSGKLFLPRTFDQTGPVQTLKTHVNTRAVDRRPDFGQLASQTTPQLLGERRLALALPLVRCSVKTGCLSMYYSGRKGDVSSIPLSRHVQPPVGIRGYGGNFKCPPTPLFFCGPNFFYCSRSV